MQSLLSRSIVFGVAALALGAMVQAQNAPTTPAAAVRTLSVATLAPLGSTWMRGLDAANRELRRQTNNTVQMRFYPGAVQGDESEMVRKMRQGRLDGAVMTGIGLGQIHRPTLAFMLPGMFASRDLMRNARINLSSRVEREFQEQGFVLASWGESGAPRLFSTIEIRSPADLRRAHPWIWRDDVILPALFTEVGAQGVPLSLPEVLSALQTNRIDTFAAPPYAAVALQWASRARFVSEGANSFGVGGIVFTRRAWDGIPEAQRPVVQRVIRSFSDLIGRNVTRDDDTALRSMLTRGVTQLAYTDAQRAEWRTLFTRARTRLVGTVSDAAWMETVRTSTQPPAAPVRAQ
jgi:TRAP-type C4-dicarboxylate transport system substrate-binding protein